MAQIKINKEVFINGRLSVSRAKDESNNNEIIVVGILSTHDYLEEINTIESERLFLDGVDVYQEDFGSNDYNIKYSFKAADLIIKPDYVPDECKVLIEIEEYKDEDNQLFQSKNFERGIQMYYDLLKKEDDNE